MNNWNFPSNNYGPEFGLNDAGIETFTGTKFSSLAREIIQNSIDARLDINLPVTVEFTVDDLEIESFPGLESMKQVLYACKEYWGNKGNEKSVRFFKDSISSLNKKHVRFMKISDYNTIGLTGSLGEEGHWHSLVKAIGTSNKSSTSGGSFGIGKHAPFACSGIRTVLYSTFDHLGNKAFQGVSKLATHLKPTAEPTIGTGYYGEGERNLPTIVDYYKIDPKFQRHEIGTDVIILDFLEEEDWEEIILKSVIENFFFAIFSGNLIIKVNGIELNKDTLENRINKITLKDPSYEAGYFLKSLKEGKKYTLTICEKNDAVFYLLTGNDLINRIAMIRSTGMRIFNKRFNVIIKFAGIFIATGEKLNKTLKEMENPSHTNWEPERLNQKKKVGDALLRKIYSKMRTTIIDLQKKEQVDEIEVGGMSQYLPDEGEELEAFDSESNKHNNRGKIKPSKIEVKKIDYPNNSMVKESLVEAETSATSEEGDLGTNTPPQGDGQRKGNGNGVPSIGKTTGDETDSLLPKSESDESMTISRTPLKFSQVRIFMINESNGEYLVSFVPDVSGEAFLSFEISGDGGNEKPTVDKSFYSENKRALAIKSSNMVGPIKFLQDKKTSLIIRLKDKKRYALEVRLHEFE